MSYNNILSLLVTNESPTPSPNGVQTVFTTAYAYRTGTLKVTRGGIRLYPTTDYTETTDTTFTLVVAPDSGEPLLVEYFKKNVSSAETADNLANIVAKIRNLIGENLVADKDIFTFESSRVFSLGDVNVSAITAVLVNGTEEAESGQWSYDEDTNKLTFENSFTFTVGDVIEVQYTKYPNYSDTELEAYAKAALTHISACQYKTFFMASGYVTPTPSEAEENLIALVASIIIKPDNKSYKLPDIGIQVPLNSSSTQDMIRQAIVRFKKSPTGIFKIISQ